MIKTLLIVLNLSFLITFGFAQIKSKKVLYDDWPTTKTTNVREKNKSTGPTTSFVPIGTTWDHRIITYYFDNGTNDINANDETQAIRDAFALWANVTDLAFVEVCTANDADIVLLWGSFNHGDSGPFDGLAGVLAHTLGGPPPNAFGDQAGDIHFDDSETWTLDTRNNMNDPVDLVTVAAHEIGHALGLDHTTISGSLMQSNYTGSHRFLGSDDIAGIQSLYGAKNNNIITGSVNLCNTETYTVQNLPLGATASWSVSPSNIVSTSSSGNSITLTKISDGSISLTASVSTPCGTTILSKNISTGAPTINALNYYYLDNNGVEQINPIQRYYSVANNVVCVLGTNFNADFSIEGASSVVPEVIYQSDPGAGWGTSGGAATLSLYSYFTDYGQEIIFRITATSACGSDVFDVGFRSEDCYGQYQYSFSPNPASDELIIEAKTEKITTKAYAGNPLETRKSFNVKLYNDKALVLREADNNGQSKVTLNTQSLANGTYYLHITEGKKTIKKQIIIQH